MDFDHSFGEKVRERYPLESFISSVRPRCTRPILQTGQIRSLLGKVEDLPSTQDLRVRQFGSRAKIRSKGASKTLESDRKWTDLSVEEAFKEIRSEGHWITDASIQFRYFSVHNAGLKITRYGIFTFRRVAGEQTLLSGFPDAGRSAREYAFSMVALDQRALTLGFDTFNIEFESAVFDEKDQVRLLQDALRKLPSVTCTVLHGNPYFHAIFSRRSRWFKLRSSCDQ